jgi:hypothetical protein
MSFSKAFWGIYERASRKHMTDLATNPIPGFFGKYCAVVPKSDRSTFIAVGDAWATAKIALSLDSNQNPRVSHGHVSELFPTHNPRNIALIHPEPQPNRR